MRTRTTSFSAREYSGALTVTILSSLFGASLMGICEALVNGMQASGLDQLSTVRAVLGFIAWVFLAIALFIGAVVTVNTFGTIIAGRAKQLALLRLLGASGRSLRRSSLREGLSVGIIGSLIGTLLGIGLLQGVLWAGHTWWALPHGIHAAWFVPSMVAPMIMAALVTMLSAWIGSRRILSITPIQAFGTAQAATETTGSEQRSSRGKIIAGILLGLVGVGLLALGVISGLSSPDGILIALPGGILSFIGFMLLADRIVPGLLHLVPLRGASGTLATRNSLRNAKRTTRSTLGIIIGVGLITMFAVAGFTYQNTLMNELRHMDGMSSSQLHEAYQILSVPVVIAMGLVGFSVLISVIGLVNSLTLSTMQRTREIGLLRALGLTRKQVRRMVFLESLATTCVAAITGLVLGIVYGWAGSMSLMGTIMSKNHMLLPTVPWQLVASVLIGAFLVTAVATLSASRPAVRVAPVRALATE